MSRRSALTLLSVTLFLASLINQKLLVLSEDIWRKLSEAFANSFDDVSASSLAALLVEVLKAFTALKVSETVMSAFQRALEYTAVPIARRVDQMECVGSHVELLLEYLEVFVADSTLVASEKSQFLQIKERLTSRIDVST